MTEKKDRKLPQAVDLEKRLISIIIQEPLRYIDQAREAGITANSFYSYAERHIFTTCLHLHEKDLEINLSTVLQRLDETDEVENCGGRSNVAEIASCETLHTGFNSYLKVIQEKHEARKIIEYAERIILEAYTSTDHENLLNSVNQTGEDFRTDHSDDNQPQTAKEVFKETILSIEERAKNPEGACLPTPWQGLNNATSGGLNLGELHFFCGRPSSGKSLVAGELINHWGNNGIPCAYHSFETSNQGMMQRIIANRNEVAINALSRGNLNKGNISAITKDLGKMDGYPVYLKRYSNATRFEVSKTIRKQVAQGIMVHVIDYLQKCDPATESEARADKIRIDSFLRDIDQIRRATGCTFIMLAQLSREAEAEKVDKLGLRHISDTSQAEKDADSIWFILKGYDNQMTEDTKDQRALYCLKGRDTATGQKIKLKMQGAYARLSYVSPYDEE